MEHIDIEPVRAEWDLMMREFELDKNRGHFKQNYEYDPSILESDPELKEEFLDLLVSSITAEYSGCVLYQEIEHYHPDLRAEWCVCLPACLRWRCCARAHCMHCVLTTTRRSARINTGRPLV